MKSHDIRQSFLDFFAANDHQRIASAPLVPHGDPTLLFTNAGMVPFKDWFLGVEPPSAPRAVSVQRCLRVSGKHNDLENVGPSPRHHTFFEMLGNFSFGDYFKELAIRLAWELVTEVWGLPPSRLFATVYEEDDEAETLWRKISSLPAGRILRCGKADNFWAMGETGPCGPCSEIFADLTPERPQVGWAEGTESGRYLEIWNLVFMQFERSERGELRPLPNPSIDTGAGLERVTAVLQGVPSNYDTDLFTPILHAAAELAGTELGESTEGDTSLRVIADHLRATSFLLADGVIPGPDGRGYVLRRLLRRAERHGQRLGVEEPFLYRLVPVLGQVMGAHYPELEATGDATVATLREEEEKYLTTRAAGARRIQEAIDRTRRGGAGVLSGEELFKLYDTHGQELDAVREIAEEERLALDEAGFEKLLEERRRAARQVTSEHQERLKGLRRALFAEGDTGETTFLGYESLTATASVVALAAQDGRETRSVEALDAGSTGVAVLDRTAFYPEGGGQVGDTGRLRWPDGSARITDTQKDPSGTIFHFVEVETGMLAKSQEVGVEVEVERRRATERNHTATHLLHAALRGVLGEGARQAGSLVTPERLRFDFTWGQPLSHEQLHAVEDEVNHGVRAALATKIVWLNYKEALAAGAMALFGEKYGERVRTVEVPGTSLELCGGCHVRNSGEIGLLLLTGERGIASGVRRIEAVTGEGALELVRQRQGWLAGIEQQLGVPAERAANEVEGLRTKLRELERELAQLRLEMVAGGGQSQDEIEVGGLKVLAREVPAAPAGELRTMADALRDKLGSGIVVLAAREGEKVTLLVALTKDLTEKLSAGRLVAQLAPIVGGKGGGRPDFAQAGGREAAKLPELLAAVPATIARELAAAPGS